MPLELYMGFGVLGVIYANIQTHTEHQQYRHKQAQKGGNTLSCDFISLKPLDLHPLVTVPAPDQRLPAVYTSIFIVDETPPFAPIFTESSPLQPTKKVKPTVSNNREPGDSDFLCHHTVASSLHVHHHRTTRLRRPEQEQSNHTRGG
ncbi:hypothetical protein SLEP1_g17607 [Rubroshorea leprosula]|uniref:Uncharacterized protein n=1 Tax=Rubroshorea leprosula TaxID=152421 RepID=A0AAV5IYI0_9ROSI|nr:hypothetical protein SLEP1_g17607 [Rubroshorea leprosula]